jgi:hypothetical protein
LLAGQLAPAAEPPDVRAALDRFYAPRYNRPFLKLPDDPEPRGTLWPWRSPLKQLASAKAEDRRAAATYLCALLAQALDDETSGKAPWGQSPYWDSGVNTPTRDLRKWFAEGLKLGEPCAEVLPVLKWYLEHERDDTFLEPVMAVLGKLDGADADALRAELATKPHPNVIVAAKALEQIAARKKTIPAEALAALCQHHRSAIRTAARALNAQRGGKDPGAFDPVKALQSEPVAQLMDRVLALMPELPGAKAELVKVTIRYLDDKKVERRTWDKTGWLVHKEGDTVAIFIPRGRVRTVRNKEKVQVTVTESVPGGSRSHEVDTVTEMNVTPAELADVVREAVRYSRAVELSEHRPPGPSIFDRATLFEATVGGAWLYRAGKDDDAAKVLLRALNSFHRDEHFVDMVREQVGELVGQKMLVAFIGERDYPAAIKHARFIIERYPNTRFHHYAKDLAEQLPKRTGDFTQLKLPTKAEWAELQKKLTREQQIEYLCERMRLLNCYQVGQPGGIDYGGPQYAEPCGLAEDASFGGGDGKTEVINPLVELTGAQSRRDQRAEKPKPKGMELTIKDVPLLSKYLRDDHYMLMVGFWRFYHPDRTLQTTRPWFAGIINGLAYRDVCTIRDWNKMTPAEVGAQIQRINKWATDNAHKTPQMLEMDGFEATLARERFWPDFEGMVEWLLKEKGPLGFDARERVLEHEDTKAQTRAGLLRLYLKHNAERARDLAPKYLRAEEPALRLAAALIVMKTGDRAKARPVLGDLVAHDPRWATAADALLGEDTPEARKELKRLFANPTLTNDRTPRGEVLTRCAAAGFKEPYAFYLKWLDVTEHQLPFLNEKGEEVGTAYYNPSVAEAFAREIVEEFAPDDETVKTIVKEHPNAKDQIPHLKKWLQTKLEKK